MVSSEGNATTTVCADLPALEEGMQAGRFNVVLGACAGPTKKLLTQGLVIPESETTLYYYRLAMFLPPTDPLGIMSAQDLDRPGLRIGLCTTRLSGPLAEKLKATAACDASWSSSRPPAARRAGRRSREGRGGPTAAGAGYHPPASRLAGDDAAEPVCGFAVRGTKRLADAESLLQFCVKSKEADHLKLARALMTGNGDSADNYRKEAGPRMMPSYISVAKQVAADYTEGAHNCLDLGCGPGR